MAVDWIWARPTIGKSDEPNLNRRGAELVGQVVMVVEPIEAEGRGKVRAADTVWAAEGVAAVVGKRVRVVAFSLIGEAAGVDIGSGIRIGGMCRVESRDRLVIVAFEDEGLSPDSVGDREILAGHLPGPNHVFTGVETRLGFGLPVAAGVHVIGQRGAGKCRRHDQDKAGDRWKESAQHLSKTLRPEQILVDQIPSWFI
jgi:hypothetical protein